MFERRQTWTDIVYTRDVKSDATIINAVEDGDEVILVHNEVGIHVIVKRYPNSSCIITLNEIIKASEINY